MKSLKQIYDQNAKRFDHERSKSLFEKSWLDEFGGHLPSGGRVLDIGCGSGRPIAEYLLSLGFRMTGTDFAPAMLDLARARFPNATWIEADMRTLDRNEVFDGVLCWDSFFHLSKDEQRAVIPRLAKHVAPGGVLMLTIGPEDGEAWGNVAGEPVFHASLSGEEYERRLANEGMHLVRRVVEDPDCDLHTVALFKKDESPD